MSKNKSPLQIHYENILLIKKTVDRWSLNNHCIVSDHIKNINLALNDDKDFFFSKSFVEKELKEYKVREDHHAHDQFKELYSNQEFLKLNIPLSNDEKLNFVKRVAARYSELDNGYIYNTIINELNSYLEILISKSPDLNNNELYEIYKNKMNSSLFGYSFTSIKKRLLEDEFKKLIYMLTDIPLFNKNDFQYFIEKDEKLNL